MAKRIGQIKNIGEKIEKIYQLDNEMKQAMQEESDAINAFIEDKKKKTVKRRDENGNEVPTDITNNEIMEEIRITRSLDSEAGRVLKEMAPGTFQKLKATAEKSQEMHDYILKEFGFSFKHMSIADYLKLTEAVIEYKNAN